MYNILQPIYSFHLDHNGERVRDDKNNGCFQVKWKIVGQAESIADAKKQGFAVPVLEKVE